MATAQVLTLGGTPGSDDVTAVAQQLEDINRARAQAPDEQDDGEEEDDEEGEDGEDGGEEEEEDGADGGGELGEKVDELKEMLERDRSNHDDFCFIFPTGKCGVCLANETTPARNGGYGCFSCNVRVCYHPDCLRDHLALMKGNTTKREMVRKERKPATGECKSHGFGAGEDD